MARCTHVFDDGVHCAEPVLANGLCRDHLNLAGREATAGRHGRSLGDARRVALAQALAAPDLLSLQHEIVLVDLRVGNLLEAVELADAQGLPTTALWSELATWFTLRVRMVEAESKRQAAIDSHVSLGQMHTFMRAVGLLIKQHIADPAIIARIDAGIDALVDLGASPPDVVSEEEPLLLTPGGP
ncbi:MAG: hypothetical protein KGL39_39055 [Patescibacteria group bacterium]|nr:hypothetical protein [Patescibacteria group bacterium]